MSLWERIKVGSLLISLIIVSIFGCYGCMAEAERKQDTIFAKAQLQKALDDSIQEQRLRAEERTREHMALEARLDRIEKFLGIK